MKRACHGCGWAIELPKRGRTNCIYCPSCSCTISWARAYFNARFGPIERGYQCVDCGKPATCRDHRDYGRLDIFDYVCHSCNTRRGPAKIPAHLTRTSRINNRLREKIDKLEKKIKELTK